MGTVFKESAIRSGLVSQRQMAKVVDKIGAEDDALIAATLVKSGLLTEYQAQQLHTGRTKLTLGPYLITDWIGQGGMGQVFKAVHKVMGRECAVKVLPLEKSTALSRDSFTREIRLQAGLDCPFVVRAYDAGRDGNVHYLVTEYVPGTDLRKLVRRGGPLSMNHAALVISQAARGLQYAHDLGLVHRDVKPGNILVTPEGHAKVSDIGLAAWSMGLDDDPRAGKIVGTADYLSPEQIRNPRAIGPASDLYSLGCTLYYTVTGKVPFPGGDSKSKCKRHCEQTPWHPRKFAPDLSEDFVDTIADMMEKDPSRRIATATEVAERLEIWCTTSFEVDRPIERQAWTAPPIGMDDGQEFGTSGADGPAVIGSGQYSSGLQGSSQQGSGNPGSKVGMVPSDSSMPLVLDQPVDPSMPRERRKPFPVGFVVGLMLGIVLGALTALYCVREYFTQQ
ncbi:Serine/threonine-protein kinase PknA [Stieleria neptunia]|uniref:Serine/threonine-protein kinase PknA n=1 Tax=Stieleria neptunia TaxID=2527979 RepID=A0A518HR83_9BACT|nr:serine/threonine-protein kinase [Stieleria neptunia]QDV43363.1 Serine/threonine-protein kinase PknA [Stieleria neptunia]